MKIAKTPLKAGRPRTFDAEQALDCAMKVFWEKGYEGSSMPELTKAMGMNRPSLYAVFGNKQELFHRAMERYNATRLHFLDAALARPSARAVVESFLVQYALAQTEPEQPPGCLSINAGLACGEDGEPARDEAAACRHGTEMRLRARLARAREEGDLALDICPEQLARYVMTVSQGMAVQAAAGASREQLQQVVAMLLRGWPAGQSARAGADVNTNV